MPKVISQNEVDLIHYLGGIVLKIVHSVEPDVDTLRWVDEVINYDDKIKLDRILKEEGALPRIA